MGIVNHFSDDSPALVGDFYNSKQKISHSAYRDSERQKQDTHPLYFLGFATYLHFLHSSNPKLVKLWVSSNANGKNNGPIFYFDKKELVNALFEAIVKIKTSEHKQAFLVEDKKSLFALQQANTGDFLKSILLCKSTGRQQEFRITCSSFVDERFSKFLNCL